MSLEPRLGRGVAPGAGSSRVPASYQVGQSRSAGWKDAGHTPDDLSVMYLGPSLSEAHHTDKAPLGQGEEMRVLIPDLVRVQLSTQDSQAEVVGRRHSGYHPGPARITPPTPLHPRRGVWTLERKGDQPAATIVDSLGKPPHCQGDARLRRGPPGVSVHGSVYLPSGVSCSLEAPALSQAPREEEHT